MAQMMSTEDETGAHVVDQGIWMTEIIITKTCMTMGGVLKTGSRDGRSRSPYGGHYRNRSRSRTRDAGKPTDTVILEGLPYSVSSAELRDGLLANSIAAELPSIDVRVSSSRGNRRAFVQFESVDQASAFVKEHFPKILIDLQHSTDDAPDGKFEAYIHYARSRDDSESRQVRAADWACPQCEFLNFSTRTRCKICGAQPAAYNWEQSLTGAADIADGAEAVSQILVVYPLASFVTEDMLGKDLRLLEKSEEPKSLASGPTKLKSTAPGADVSRYGAKPKSLHRVFLMREVSSGESFKYGFAEFWTLEDAAAAMTKFRMSRSFTVAGCAVTVAPTHMGVFLPEDREITSSIEHLSFSPLFNPSLRVRYRDTHVFPSQLVVTPDPPVDVSLSAAKSADDEQGDKKQRKRKAEGSVTAPAAKKSVPMAGQMAVWQRKHNELRGAEGGALPNGHTDPAASKTTAPIKISLSNSTKLGSTSAPPASPSRLSPRESSPNKEASPQPAAPDSTGLKEETYTDRDRLMCLICMRKYKSIDEVDIHEKSRNHKTATQDDDKVKAALLRLATRDKRQKQDPQATQYRDRAKERRDIYNQPKRPSQPTKPKTESKKPLEEAKPAAKVASKGAGMLAKMGWTTGAGLGANNDGRTEAIATNAYQEGVGLGAEGSNLGDAAELAERKTKGSYSDYLTSVQDKARQRYNQMN
ncbi:D111/G-patch [Metarhizium rileyi]|uniref:D111/G-patch n=1 Tax=Metarhizium rileyi (strain RCEF 4871) TaxID=1649241 RepID=A0A162LYF6_METRR|nr:D111/G-patch [Metarhizium rileyi RCEF 4871]